jgi:hypothetical protein
MLVFRPPAEIIKAGSEDEEVDPSSNRARAGSTSAPSPVPRDASGRKFVLKRDLMR